MPEQGKGRLQLVLIAAVFFGPVMLAWLLYNPGGAPLRGNTTAHGELITPVKLVADTNLSVPREQQDSPYPGRWTLVHVGEGACDERCVTSLYETRQVRQALGKENQRVQRFYFLLDDTPLDATMAAEHQDLQIFAANLALTNEFFAAIEPFDTHSVFLIDPLGNLIMRFAPDSGMKGMHQDLKKLLKISKIG